MPQADLVPKYTASVQLSGGRGGQLDLLPTVPIGIQVQLAPFLQGDPGPPGSAAEMATDPLAYYILAKN